MVFEYSTDSLKFSMPRTLCRWSARGALGASSEEARALHRIPGVRSTDIQGSIGIIDAFAKDLILMDKHASHWRLVGPESLLCLRSSSAEEPQTLWNRTH